MTGFHIHVYGDFDFSEDDLGYTHDEQPKTLQEFIELIKGDIGPHGKGLSLLREWELSPGVTVSDDAGNSEVLFR